MKKLGLFALAMALLVTLSQCKKEKPGASNNESVKVPITLNVSGGNGSRVDVNTENGKVTFENGDALYVASNGVYVGMLIYNGIKFSGEVTEPTEGQKLHFYFLGNVDTEETLTEGTSTGCSVVISDQTENLPVISYNTSRENYEVGRTDYNATLLNKCALVKFNVTTPSNSPICITGMKNKVTVDFANNTLTPSQDGEGVIMLPAGSGENVEKWAILLPQEALEEGEEGSAYSEDGLFVGIRPAIVGIDENVYWADGLSVSVSLRILPEGAINGLFTVNENGDKVYFSSGNMQYIGSAAEPYWQFAEHQWDYIGNNSGQNSNSQTADRDLFGWGTSGYNHGASSYYPWSTSTSYSQYYAYGSSSYNLYDQTGQADWGYNAIANGGDTENYGWRTLTNAEWSYVFNTRTGAALKKGHGKVNGMNGMILLPDEWTLPNGLTFTSGNSSWANVYSGEQWAQMEASGAVFLPAAGDRNGPSLYDVGSYGFYWSSSYSSSDYAYGVYFSSGRLNPQYNYYRSDGYSVRLVRPAEK